ncbi:hypothetical protein FHW36_1011327 [Chitinophaga polysaccharea]|uniref:Uncharacterized protein n=1 Tax=Chitinophaga polysaccharea TaxID=1293035 RepID=A0A561Q4V0_9BACT|nr:hypothetical protein [Chitinophaga polysaccharea]TWF45397.1 hypothetical protein FHW36_1011327 [Chitinophaga polysaccharea]
MTKYRSLLAGAWLLCFLSAVKLHAQVVMTVQVPPTGIMQQSQLWNMVLTNSYTYPVRVLVMMRLSDAISGQPVLTGISGDVQLAPGAKQLQWKDMGPVQYEYLSPVTDRRENALLPPGSYNVCYSVVLNNDSHHQAPATEDCRRFTVEPMSPPLLNTPANSEVVETPLPQFTWIPPAPLNLFTDLNYDMVLVEVTDNQSAEEAVQTNMPVYRVSNLHQPFLSYPAGAPVLDTGITYAWMITANNARQFAAQTSTWTFRMKQPGRVLHDDVSAYVQMKRERNTVINCGNTLKCSYVNDAADANVNYEVLSLEDNNRVVRHGIIALEPGTNMIALPLERGSRLSTGKLYVFRFTNGRAENWEVKFIYHPES